MPRKKTDSVMLSSLIDSFVAEARTSRGWNQVDLAVHAGIRPETLSRIKGGCQFDTLERLAKVLGLRIIAVPDDDYVQQVLTGSGFTFDEP